MKKGFHLLYGRKNRETKKGGENDSGSIGFRTLLPAGPTERRKKRKAGAGVKKKDKSIWYK